MITITEGMFFICKDYINLYCKVRLLFQSWYTTRSGKNCFHNKCEITVLGKPQVLNPGNRNCYLLIIVMKNTTFVFLPLLQS